MKKSNTYQPSFSHNDTAYELWHDSRYKMAEEYSVIYLGDEEEKC